MWNRPLPLRLRGLPSPHSCSSTRNTSFSILYSWFQQIFLSTCTLTRHVLLPPILCNRIFLDLYLVVPLSRTMHLVLLYQRLPSPTHSGLTLDVSIFWLGSRRRSAPEFYNLKYTHHDIGNASYGPSRDALSASKVSFICWTSLSSARTRRPVSARALETLRQAV